MGILYTFYSYKGGVGRSMALANVAALLSSWGHSVLAIDWDLEAPGLEKYFLKSPSRLVGTRSEKRGVVDIVTAFAGGSPLAWEECLLEAHPYGTDARVDIIGAGQDTPRYVPDLQAINWPRLFNEQGFGAYLEGLRDEWLNKYDFVLVDSRTGITDIGGVCTIHLPDVLVLLFTANEQSLAGVLDVLRRAQVKYGELPPEYERPPKLFGVPVPSRLEYYTENTRSREWMETLPGVLAGVFKDWLPEGTPPDKVIEQLFVPNIAVWSFGENLPVVQEGTSNPKSIGFSYALLARLLENRLQWGELSNAESATAGERTPDAFNREAESAFEGLSKEEREVAGRVLPNLVRVAPKGEGENTRRRVPLSELDEKSRRVVGKLTETRLLASAHDEATGEETVEIAQDGTLRHWERLKHWLEEERSLLLLRQQLRDGASTWASRGRSLGDLLHGSKLEEAEDLMETRGGLLADIERDYIAASVKQAATLSRARRLRVAGVVALLVIITALMVAFYYYRQNQREQEQAQRELNYNRAVSLTAQGIDLADTREFTAAVVLYNQAVELAPDYDLAYHYRGIALANLDQRPQAVADFQKVLQISKNEQTRRVAQNYLQQMQGPGTPPEPEPTPTSDRRPRAYITIQDNADMQKAEQVAAALQKQDFFIQPILVRSGPQTTEVRFYRNADADTADEVVKTLADLGVTDAQKKYLIGYEKVMEFRPKHYEVWFGPKSLGNVSPLMPATR